MTNKVAKKTNSYNMKVLNEIEIYLLRKHSKFDKDYWTWFSNTEDFKEMIAIAQMNRHTPKSAAKTILYCHSYE